MYRLGIHDGHNSAACLMMDGEVVYSAQEERFRRIKNYWGPPIEAVRASLRFANLQLADLSEIVFSSYQHPTKSYTSRDDYINYTREMLRSKSIKAVLRSSLDRVKSIISSPRYELGARLSLYEELGFRAYSKDNIKTVQHHLCHFATAAFGSDNGRDKDLLVITVDGYGDGEDATVSILSSTGQIKKLISSPDTHPFAKIYAWVTVFLGFIHLEHEYKLMGMAPYANPSRARKMADKFTSLVPFQDGSWSYWRGPIRTEVDDHLIYSDIRRICEFERFDDICGGLQLFSEELIVKFVEFWVQKTGIRNVALSGGFFMNVKANQILKDSSKIEKLYIFPSCGDETNAMGAAMYSYFFSTGQRPKPIQEFTLGDAVADPSKEELLSYGVDARSVEITHYDDIEMEVARLLAKGEIVARVKGREEFGARAMGNRSILANPSEWRTVQIINDMIKSRDFWMPFAASVLDDAREYYLKNYNENYAAHYMVMTYDSLNTKDIFAATHPKDGTVRPQVVTKVLNPDYYRLIKAFRDMTGIGAVLNTSYNLHGYPLVHSIKDAVEVFLNSGLKFLAVGNQLLAKKSF